MTDLSNSPYIEIGRQLIVDTKKGYVWERVSDQKIIQSSLPKPDPTQPGFIIFITLLRNHEERIPKGEPPKRKTEASADMQPERTIFSILANAQVSHNLANSNFQNFITDARELTKDLNTLLKGVSLTIESRPRQGYWMTINPVRNDSVLPMDTDTFHELRVVEARSSPSATSPPSRPHQHTLKEVVGSLRQRCEGRNPFIIPGKRPEGTPIVINDLVQILYDSSRVQDDTTVVDLAVVYGSGLFTSLQENVNKDRIGLICDALYVPELVREIEARLAERNVKLLYDTVYDVDILELYFEHGEGLTSRPHILAFGLGDVNAVSASVFGAYELRPGPKDDYTDANIVDPDHDLYVRGPQGGCGCVVAVSSPLWDDRLVVICAGVDGGGTIGATWFLWQHFVPNEHRKLRLDSKRSAWRIIRSDVKEYKHLRIPARNYVWRMNVSNIPLTADAPVIIIK